VLPWLGTSPWKASIYPIVLWFRDHLETWYTAALEEYISVDTIPVPSHSFLEGWLAKSPEGKIRERVQLVPSCDPIVRVVSSLAMNPSGLRHPFEGLRKGPGTQRQPWLRFLSGQARGGEGSLSSSTVGTFGVDVYFLRGTEVHARSISRSSDPANTACSLLYATCEMHCT